MCLRWIGDQNAFTRQWWRLNMANSQEPYFNLVDLKTRLDAALHWGIKFTRQQDSSGDIFCLTLQKHVLPCHAWLEYIVQVGSELGQTFVTFIPPPFSARLSTRPSVDCPRLISRRCYPWPSDHYSWNCLVYPHQTSLSSSCFCWTSSSSWSSWTLTLFSLQCCSCYPLRFYGHCIVGLLLKMTWISPSVMADLSLRSFLSVLARFWRVPQTHSWLLLWILWQIYHESLCILILHVSFYTPLQSPFFHVQGHSCYPQGQLEYH